jgi:diadenylate cyclase
VDVRSEETLRSELAKVAPGTALREGLDHILSARTGALIVIGDERNVEAICNGGFDIATPFSAQRLFELAKMDGAIVMDSDLQTIRKANVHLVPDPGLPTSETGMRHRTAERVSRQTRALVISISQRRDVVSLYFEGRRVILEDTEVVLAKANQALQTLQRYRVRLEEVLERLTVLEFDDLVTLGDVAEVLSRFEMVRRVANEVNRYIAELGTDGRLVSMQAEELTAGVDDDYLLVIRDYALEPTPRKASATRAALGRLTPDQFVEPSVVAQTLALPSEMQSSEDHLRPRGFRVLRRIPLLPATVVARIVERFGSMPELLHATKAQLDEVDGVGERRARAISDGLARMRTRLAS